MKPTPYSFIILGMLSAPTVLQANLMLTEVQSDQAATNAGDYWELTNTGTTAVDISGYRWTDRTNVNSNFANGIPIPASTSIAAGESIIFTHASAANFRTWWGSAMASGTRIFPTPAGDPGLGNGDGVTFFDSTGTMVFQFSYGAGGFTKADGSASTAGHAGAAAGGTATQAAVWVPSSGTSSPRYTYADGTTNGTFPAATNAADKGSPGYSGFGAGGPTITLTLGISPAEFSESASNPAATGTVTRTGGTTAALVVTLASADTTEATVPATVTIPIGSSSITFPVTAVNDSFPDGDKVVAISANATGASFVSSNVTVKDDGDVLTTKLMLTEVLSDQNSSAAGTEDYWELTNFGTSAVSLTGYSWHDSGRSAVAAAAWKLPAGASIAPGESVIFTVADPAAFRAWWNISSAVKVFQTVGAPGLGKGDGISFFEESGNEYFFFSYAGGGFLREDGTPSTAANEHTGIAGGGTLETQALVWVPGSGTTGPRYTAATGANHGSFKAASGEDYGSPGIVVGVPAVSIGNASVTEGDSGSKTLSLDVTRTDLTTAFTVGYAVTGGSATSPEDFTLLGTGTLSFAAGGAASQPVQLAIAGDVVTEQDETIEITLANVANTTGVTVIGNATGVATILNDDPVTPVITTPPPAAVTVISGGTTTLTLAVTGTPAPAIQWYRGEKGDTTTPVGTNSPSFTTPALTATTKYWARITNSAGSVDTETITVSIGTAPSTIDLSSYVRVGRYDLPEPTRTTPPAPGNLLCQEASGVAYNWDTDTLFIACDGGKSITQISKTGQLIDTMTLANGSSPQGTDFYDPEGITYIGNGQFVMTEERDRQLVRFTYAAGTTLSRSGAKTVKLGTFVDNTGTEGLSWDPRTGGFICLKEISPMGIFQTNVDFEAGTATNGSPTTENSINLFDPVLTGFTDLADVYALSNLPFLEGKPQSGNLLLLSQENARIINVDRNGNIASSLQIVTDPGNPLTAANQQHEGLTMDRDGNIYVVNENGGGDIDHPQLWVYSPSAVPNQAPTAIALANAVTTLAENTNTTGRLKVADIVVTDDGLGTNTVSVSGVDASFFEVLDGVLYVKAGTVLDYETKSGYSITVNVDDTTLGATPDASVAYTLTLTDVVNETPVPTLIISEVAPWSSSSSPVGADWFEVTNTGATAVTITGWAVDDDSNSFGSARALTGITSIAPGESVIFIEADSGNFATRSTAFKNTWFGGNPPAGLQIGSYTGSGIGLSGDGDQVNLFNAGGVKQAGVIFGISPTAAPFASFNNGEGLDGTTISRLSVPGVHGAFRAVNDANEIGSPGTTGRLVISEIAPWGSGSSPYGADWFEVTNAGARPVNVTGWRVDDNSNTFANAIPLNGIGTIAPGESVIFIETATMDGLAAMATSFRSTWFGANAPADLQIGSYSGGGIGLSTGGDQVNLYNAAGTRVTGVAFGAAASGPFSSFENRDALNTEAMPMIATLSQAGRHGARAAVNDVNEIGSPGTTGPLVISEVAPWSSGDSAVGADWFEVTNSGVTVVELAGWKVDDSSESPAASAALNGVSSIAPGESVIFIDTAAPGAVIPAFRTHWFGATPPAGLQIGSYTGSGIGLSTDGDAVNLFNSLNRRKANVSFGIADSTAPFATFDNAAGVNPGAVTLLSQPGKNGAFTPVSGVSEIGSPGTIVNGPKTPGTFEFWLAANSYQPAEFDDDSDGDGVPDGMEYFLGGNPNFAGDYGNLPEVTPTSGDRQFSFSRLAGILDISGGLQVSSDLKEWYAALPGVDFNIISETPNGSVVDVVYSLLGTGDSAAGVSETYLTPHVTPSPAGASLGGAYVISHGMVGVGRLSGDLVDKFGETMGAASGLYITNWAYNSGANRFTGTFNVLPDRGFNSGEIFSNYATRIHEIDFTFTPYYGTAPVSQGQVAPVYRDSVKLTYQDGGVTKFTTGLNATGTATLFGQTVGVATAANGPGGGQQSLVSFDAEALHLFPDGSGYASDEYGTYIARFDAAKRITGITQLPASARPYRPAGSLNFDSVNPPATGRRNNQGLEGMSVSPDRSRLFALMQSALVQDTNGAQQQTRQNTRLYVFDISGDRVDAPLLVGEYVVKLPRFDFNGDGSALDRTAAQSEIVAIGNTQFLMLPRDGNGLGVSTTNPTVYKTVQVVDFGSATNILGQLDGEGQAVSPAGTLNPAIKPAAAKEVINLLDPADHTRFGINTNNSAPNSFTFNEKIEGMALVPDLSTPEVNDFFLFVANDNDFQAGDVKMIDASGALVSYGDGRSTNSTGRITNDGTYYVYRLSIDIGRRFFRMGVDE